MGLAALVGAACSGVSSRAGGSPGQDGGIPNNAAGFVPTLGLPLDAATPGPRDPVPCGEMGLAFASAVAYSPGGALLAVAGPRLRLLDTSGWREVRQLDGSRFRSEALQRLAFAANGTVLLGASYHGALGLWRVEDGAFLYSLDFPGLEPWPRWQQVATSNTPLLALTDVNTVVLWDLEKQAVAGSMAPTQGKVCALSLSGNADVLALAEGELQVSEDLVSFATTQISIWDAHRGSLLRTISVNGSTVSALALSPDSKTLAMLARKPDCQTTCDTWVSFYSVADGQLLRHTAAWRAGQGSTGVGYLPGGDLVAVASASGLWLIRVSDAAVVNVIPDFSGNPAFSPDGTVAIPGNSIEIRKISDGTIVDLIPASTGNQAPTFSPDGQSLASVDGNDVVLWRVAEGRVATRFTGLGKNVQTLAFSPDGQTLSSGGKDGMVRMWGLDQSADPVAQRQGQPVTSVVFSPDGSILATADNHGNIYIRDSNTRKTTNIWYGQGSVSALAFSPDGRRLASGGTGPALRLWDAQTGEPLTSAGHGAGVVALAFSPDGSRLATAAAKSACGDPCPQDEGAPEILIWRVTDTSLAVESTIPTVPQDLAPEVGLHVNTHAAVWGLAFAPDGKTLLTAGPQNAGHIYQVPEGNLLASFGSFFAGTPFAVSPDASRIVIGSSPIEMWCTAEAMLKQPDQRERER
jgi:WD40 repeat protein